MKGTNMMSSASAAIAAVILFLCGVLVQVAPVCAAEDAAGTASGYVSLNGKKISLNHAYAMAQPNAFDEKKTDIAVLLTEEPLPEGALRDVQGLEYAAHGKHNYALFKINDEGKPIYEVIEHPVLKDIRLAMSGFTWAEFVPEVFGTARIRGSFKTPAETDFGGYKYEISVRFSASVVQAVLPEPLPDARTGKALPPDGGAPAKAYFAYLKAIKKKDVAGVRAFLQTPAGVEVSDDELREGLEFMAAATPKNLKLVNGYSSTGGDRAALYLTGTDEGEKVYGTVRMIQKNGRWLVTEENWSNVPPEE